MWSGFSFFELPDMGCQDVFLWTSLYPCRTLRFGFWPPQGRITQNKGGFNVCMVASHSLNCLKLVRFVSLGYYWMTFNVGLDPTMGMAPQSQNGLQARIGCLPGLQDNLNRST